MLVRGALTILEAAQLFLPVDVQPEFQHQDAVLREVLLEVVDFLVRPPPISLARQPLDALDQYATVPAAVKDCDFSLPRQLTPEPPEVVMCLLLVGGCPDRDDVVVA